MTMLHSARIASAAVPITVIHVPDCARMPADARLVSATDTSLGDACAQAVVPILESTGRTEAVVQVCRCVITGLPYKAAR